METVFAVRDTDVLERLRAPTHTHAISIHANRIQLHT